MNRFFTLLLAASCLTAVGQATVITPLYRFRKSFYWREMEFRLSATSSDPLIWNLDVVADSIFVTSCGIYEVQELIDWGNGLITPCAFISVISVVSEECPETLIPSFCGEGTVWDIALRRAFQPIRLTSTTTEASVQLNDLLDLLTAYGDCGAEESVWQDAEIRLSPRLRLRDGADWGGAGLPKISETKTMIMVTQFLRT